MQLFDAKMLSFNLICSHFLGWFFWNLWLNEDIKTMACVQSRTIFLSKQWKTSRVSMKYVWKHLAALRTTLLL